MDATATKDLTLTFGRHKGTRIQRVPVGYLLWASNEENIPQRDDIVAELERRGTTLPKLEVSGHAIDRVSLNSKTRAIWHETSEANEGLHSWLCRVAWDARTAGHHQITGDDSVAYHIGLKFVYEEGCSWPSLKTVMPKKDPHGH